MKTKYKLHAVAVLCLSSLINSASAFVSYNDPRASGNTSLTPTPELHPLLNSNAMSDNNSGLSDYQNLNYKNQNNANNSECTSGVIHIGEPVQQKERHYRGSGTLSAAARKMVPKGWRVKVRRLPSEEAYWDLQEQWYFVLGIAARSVQGCATINWNEKTVEIAGNEDTPKAIHTNSNSNHSNDFNANPLSDVATDEPFKPFEPNALIPTTNSWTLNEQKTLRENMIEWGKIAGWRVVWSIKNTDFRVIQTTLVGDYDSAIEQITEAYRDTNNPIAVNQNEANRVIEFINYTPFQRTIVEQ